MKTARIKIFALFLASWIFFSICTLFYNGYKTVFEIKEWVPLSDYEKRHKVFGNLYDFLLFVSTKTKKSETIVIFSEDVRTHYFGMYTLFPRKVITISEKKALEEVTKEKKYTYIAVFNSQIKSPFYQQISNFNSRDKKDFGFLYKRK